MNCFISLFLLQPPTPFSPKCLSPKVTPTGIFPHLHHLHSNLSPATASRCNPRKVFCIIGREEVVAGSPVTQQKNQPRPEGSCDLVGSSEGDRGIAKLRNLPPRLLPPSPRPRAASLSLCSAGSSHPGAQPPRSSTPLGSPPPTGSQENSPRGMGLV